MKIIKALTLTACMLAMTPSLQAQQGPIKIGVVTPLSGTYTGIG